MNAKFTLAIIALIGIGVFALPSTMSLFTGQHAFYNIDAEGNQVPCAKCHGDIQSELKSTHSETTGTDGPHAAMTCEMCHRAEKGAAFGDNVYVRSAYGNASFVLITTMANYQVGNYPLTWNLTQQTGQCDKTGVIGSGTLFTGVDCWALKSGNAGLLSKAGGSSYGTPYDGQMARNTSYVGAYNEKAGRIIFETLYEEGVGPKDTSALATTNFNPKNVTVQLNGFQNEPTGSDADSLFGAGSRIVTPGTRYHAASLVSCMECHGSSPFMHHYTDDAANSCVDCHYSNEAHTPTFENMFAAGGFGITSFANDTGEVEAHNAWVKTNDSISRFGSNSKSTTAVKANNDACIACHTHVAVDINFTKGYKLAFDAKESATGVYTTGAGKVEGSVTISVYGNQSGETFAVGDQSITWTSDAPMYLNGNKSTAPVTLVLTSDASDAKTAFNN